MTAVTTTDTPVPHGLTPSPERGDQPQDLPGGSAKKGIRLRVPTAVAALAAIALVGAGVGAQLKEHSASSSAATGTATGGPQNTNGAPGSGIPGGFTTGTVTSVEGSTIHLTDANGAAVTVTVPTAATITSSEVGAMSDLTVGSFIAVTGTTTADGTTTASTILLGRGQPGGAGNGVPPAGQ